MARLLYLDSSALVKLVLPEAETPTLIELVADGPDVVTSALASVEVSRAARRASEDPSVHRRAEQVLAGVHLLRIDDAILRRAADLGPPTLRSLDALHLASALEIADELSGFVAYDRDLGAAAAAAGLEALAPGAP